MSISSLSGAKLPAGAGRRAVRALAASAALLLAVQAAVADTYTYSPVNAASDAWSLGTDWDSTPVSGASTELTFVGSNATVIPDALNETSTNDIGVFSLNILDLQGTGPVTTPAVITIASAAGNSLNFVSNTGGPVVNLNAVSGTAALTYNVTSNISLGNDTTFTGDGTAVFNFSGVISGAANLTKSGLSALTLGGANTFGGVGHFVTLNAGTLNVGNAAALGDANNTLVINGGNIDNTSGGAMTLAANYVQTWGGDFTFLGGGGATHDLNLGTGAISLGANAGTVRTVTVLNGTLTVGGVISDGATVNMLAKAGAGTLALTGLNTYDGGTSLGGGTLSFTSGSLGATGTISFTASSTLLWNGHSDDLSGRIMIGDGVTATMSLGNNTVFASGFQTGTLGTGGFTKTGAGSLTINAANTYSGGTTISAGTVILGNIQALGTGSVSLAGGTTMDIETDNPANAYNVTATGSITIAGGRATSGPAITNTLGTLTIGGNTLTTTSGSNVASGTPVIAFANVTLTGNPTFTPTTAAMTLGTVTGTNRSINLSGTTAGNSVGAINTGTGTVAKSTAATWTFAGTSSYSGATTLGGGNAIVAADNAFGTGMLNMSASSATLQSSGSHSLANPVAMNNSGFTINGSGNLTFTGALSFNTSGGGNLTVNSSGVTTFSGGWVMSNSSGARTDTLEGTGNVVIDSLIQPLSSATSAQNITFIGGGTLTLSAAHGGSVSGLAGTGASALIQVANSAAPSAVVGNSILQIAGNYTIGSAGAASLVVKGGNGTTTTQGTLSLVDGAPNTLFINSTTAGSTVLTMAGGAGLPSILNMEVGSSADKIALGSGLKASIGAGGVLVNIIGIGNLSGSTQDLLTTANTTAFTLAPGTNPNFTLNTATGNFSGYTVGLSVATTGKLQLTETNLVAAPTAAFWKGGLDNTWSTFTGGNANNTNWVTDATGATDTHQIASGNTNVIFSVTGGGSNLNTRLGADFTINSLEFTADAGPSAAVSISGNTLTLNASGANGNAAGNGITVDNGAGAETINSNVTLAAAQTWTVNNDPAAPLAINGVIHDGGFGVVKAGAGTLSLGGANAFTGGLTIDAGTVRLTGSSALNATTPQAVTFAAGAASGTRLQLNGNSVTSGALASDSATPNNPIIENAGSHAATLTVAQSTDSNYYGILQDGAGGGALSLIKAGTGALTLSGTNTHTGTTTVANGSLLINGSLPGTSAVSVAANADLAVATIGGTGTINGTVMINTPTGSGRTNEITGAGVGSIGTLILTSGLTLQNGGVGYFDIANNGANDLINITSGGLTANAGSIIRVTSGLTTADTYHLIDFTGTAPALADFSLQNFSGNALPGNYSLSVTANSVDLVVASAGISAAPDISILTPISGIRVMKSTSVAITGNVTNSGTADLNASLSDNGGNLTVSNFNPSSTFTVPTPNGSVGYSATIADTGTTLGTRTFSVKVSDPAADPTSASASGSLVVLDNRVVASTNAPNFGLLHVGAAVTATTNLTSPGSDNNFTRVTVANGSDANGIAVSGGSPGTIFDGTFTDTRTISGNITALGTVNGAINLVTTGEAGLAGQAPVNVTVSYTAQVFSGKAAWNVAAGGNWNVDGNWADTVAPDIGGIGAPGLSGALSNGDTATFGDLAGEGSATTVNLNGATPSLAGVNFTATSTSYTLTGTVGLNLQLAATPIDVVGTHTISAVLSGLGFNKTDTGTLVLAATATDTYTGATSVSNGILEITASDNRLPAGTALTLGDPLANTSGKVVLGDGTTPRILTVATLASAGTGTGNSVVGSAATNSTLIVGGSGSTTFAGTLGGAGVNENNLNLTKNGSGTLVLTGDNTYSGTTTFGGGELGLGSANAIGTTGLITFSGGTLQFSAANTSDVSSSGRLNSAITNQVFSFDTNGQNVTLAGSLPGIGAGLSKSGAGTLIVNSGVFNGVGTTTVSGGVLQELGGIGNSTKLALSGSSSLYGVFQTNGDYTGAGANAPFLLGSSLTWGAFSGFAAKGGPLTIQTDFGQTEYWGVNNFMSSGSVALVFGSPTADDKVEYQNNIDFGDNTSNLSANFQRNIVVDGPAAAPTGANTYGFTGNRALLSGVLSANNPYSAGPPVLGDLGNNGFNKEGSGILILSGQNTYSGPTVVLNGILVAGTNALVGQAGAFGDGHAVVQAATTINGTQLVTLGGGNVNGSDGTAANGASPSLYIGGAFTVAIPVTVANIATTGTYTIGGSMNADATFSGLITMSQPLTVAQVATTGTDALNITGNITGGATSAVKNLTFANVGAVDVSTGVISDGAGGGKIALVQNGPGVTTVSSQNTFSGGTTINGGMFLVTNTAGSATGTGAVTLNGGILGGPGFITGAVSAGTGPYTIAPSVTLAAGSISTLSLGGLTTSSSTTLTMNLNAPGVSDRIAITGAAGSLTVNGGKLVVNDAAGDTGLASLGYSKIIGYTGPIGGAGITSVVLPASPGNHVVYTLDDAHDAGFVDLHRGFEGDADDDGAVDYADFLILTANYGDLDRGWGGADFNGDGITNALDFALLTGNLGNSIDGSPVVITPDQLAAIEAFNPAVPEPSSLALLGLGAGVLLRRRRRI